MGTQSTYNGWHNRATWSAATYIFDHVADWVAEDITLAIEQRGVDAWTMAETINISERLKDWFCEEIGWDEMTYIQRDLCELWEIDFIEIAQHIVDDVIADAGPQK